MSGEFVPPRGGQRNVTPTAGTIPVDPAATEFPLTRSIDITHLVKPMQAESR